MRVLKIMVLGLLLVPSVAGATRYGSLKDVNAMTCSVTVNQAAEAMGLEPQEITGQVASLLAAQGIVTDRKSPYRLVVLCDGITLAATSGGEIPSDTHFVALRMYLVRDRTEGALVLWEDMAYGGWSLQGTGIIADEVGQWLGGMCKDLALDYFRDAADGQPVVTP